MISAICKPGPGDKVQVDNQGQIEVKGYAWSGGGQKIVRVDVTIDGGDTWHVANLDQQDAALPPQHWSWTLWSIKIPVDKHTNGNNNHVLMSIILISRLKSIVLCFL